MRIEFLAAEQVVALADQFADVYRAAFAVAPYFRLEPEVAEFARALPHQTKRESFRAVVALQNSGPPFAGIAYGYQSQPGQWWYDNVSRALGDRTAQIWLADAFQVTEVAVMPAHQRQGIGGALLNALLRDLPHGRAVLSTLDAETPGRVMYRDRGWQDLLDNFYFPGVPRRYVIMGQLLRLEAG